MVDASPRSECWRDRRDKLHRIDLSACASLPRIRPLSDAVSACSSAPVLAISPPCTRCQQQAHPSSPDRVPHTCWS